MVSTYSQVQKINQFVFGIWKLKRKLVKFPYHIQESFLDTSFSKHLIQCRRLIEKPNKVTVMQFWEDMLYLAVGNKLHIYDISISFDKELKTIQEMKNINFVFIDNQSRLFTVQDKTVGTQTQMFELEKYSR